MPRGLLTKPLSEPLLTSRLITCRELETVFNALSADVHRTRLIGCEGDPFYAACNENRRLAEIRYVKDSLPSALHELAHWCVAGPERRAVDDYGYWYNPDGRSKEEQRVFEGLEVKPQAVEWLLSVAVGRPFIVSCDNLRGEPYDLGTFRRRIRHQAISYLENPRSKRFDDLLQTLIKVSERQQAWEDYWSSVFSNDLLPDA